MDRRRSQKKHAVYDQPGRHPTRAASTDGHRRARCLRIRNVYGHRKNMRAVLPINIAEVHRISGGSVVSRAEQSRNPPYLAILNPEQRLRSEYGGPNYADAGPPSDIAGRRDGKPNTLALTGGESHCQRNGSTRIYCCRSPPRCD